ncbi:hypothetical protein HDU83_007488 [Entophlyctis luteolus]|nr:hypothetical protein HDU83_007488 [Entophlyctis luteolus]
MSGKYAALVDVDADTDAGLRPVGAAVVSSAAASVPTSSEPHSTLFSTPQSRISLLRQVLQGEHLPDPIFLDQNVRAVSSGFECLIFSAGTAPAAQAPQPQNASAQSAFWTIEYYARYFDVDTTDVVQRVIAALIPKDNFLDKISSNPDLYGS